MASIRKRTLPDSGRVVWLVDYRDQEGRRRFKQFNRRKDADIWLVEARGQVAAGIHQADRGSITVSEAAERWIGRCEAEGLEASTIRQYRQHVDYHITPLIGGQRLPRLTVPRVERFRDELVASRSRAMAAKVLTSLKGLIKEAQRRGLVAQNVAREVSIRTSARHKTPVEIPTKGEVKALLDAVPPPLATAGRDRDLHRAPGQRAPRAHLGRCRPHDQGAPCPATGRPVEQDRGAQVRFQPPRRTDGADGRECSPRVAAGVP
jgi:integrase